MHINSKTYGFDHFFVGSSLNMKAFVKILKKFDKVMKTLVFELIKSLVN